MDYTNSEKKITGSRELEFVIFCIENLAVKLGEDSRKVFMLLNENNIINGYIVPEYEVLHTQSREYILQDILEVMEERGIKV